MIFPRCRSEQSVSAAQVLPRQSHVVWGRRRNPKTPEDRRRAQVSAASFFTHACCEGKCQHWRQCSGMSSLPQENTSRAFRCLLLCQKELQVVSHKGTCEILSFLLIQASDFRLKIQFCLQKTFTKQLPVFARKLQRWIHLSSQLQGF